MKSVIVLAALTLSANSFALDVRAPQIFFNAGEATTAVSVVETCVDGDFIKTNEMKEVFAHVRQGKKDVLVVAGEEILSHPRTYTKTINVGGDKHPKEIEVVVTIPLKYEIDVYSYGHGDREGKFLYTKSFTIPACN